MCGQRRDFFKFIERVFDWEKDLDQETESGLMHELCFYLKSSVSDGNGRKKGLFVHYIDLGKKYVWYSVLLKVLVKY